MLFVILGLGRRDGGVGEIGFSKSEGDVSVFDHVKYSFSHHENEQTHKVTQQHGPEDWNVEDRYQCAHAPERQRKRR